MSSKIRIAPASTAEQLQHALRIRREVFVQEQQIPAELDDDGEDDAAIHVLAFDEDEAIATARLSAPDQTGFAVMARVAVLQPWRGQGLGAKLVQELEGLGQAQGVSRIELHPHEYLHDFYAALGYEQVGGEMQVGGHRLIVMEKHLS